MRPRTPATTPTTEATEPVRPEAPLLAGLLVWAAAATPLPEVEDELEPVEVAEARVSVGVLDTAG